MARTSLYDSMKWLKKVKQYLETNNMNTFTANDIKEIFERKYFNVIRCEAFIEEVDKIKIKGNPRPVIVWKLNEITIKKHRNSRFYFE